MLIPSGAKASQHAFGRRCCVPTFVVIRSRDRSKHDNLTFDRNVDIGPDHLEQPRIEGERLLAPDHDPCGIRVGVIDHEIEVR